MSPDRRFRYRTRFVPLAAFVLIVIVAVVILLSGGASPSLGYDISYPQCSGSYPSSPLFAVVGVNGGVPSRANPCLSGELNWAHNAPGQERPRQPAVSLYIDTGNPGAHHLSDWPTGGSAPAYGTCNGLLTNSCSYIYGEQRAAYSYRLVAALDPVTARTAPWWLDVELTLSWARTYQLNIAALQGYVAGLREAGVRGPVGIYSTSAQWMEITGLTARTTRTAFKVRLADWVAGTQASLTQAQRNCVGIGFTGEPPSLAQYQSGALDADLRCS